MCEPCIVEIADAGSRTRMAFIFAELPRVGDEFALDEPRGMPCVFVVVAVKSERGRPDFAILDVRRRTPAAAAPSFASARAARAMQSRRLLESSAVS